MFQVSFLELSILWLASLVWMIWVKGPPFSRVRNIFVNYQPSAVPTPQTLKAYSLGTIHPSSGGM